MLSEPYPELGSVLGAFVAGVQNALGKNFLGAYLVGSLATGDFDLDSDVDFLVVTNADLREQELQSLQANHVNIYALECYPSRHLEGSYISLEILRRGDVVTWLASSRSGTWTMEAHRWSGHFTTINGMSGGCFESAGLPLPGPIRKHCWTRYARKTCAEKLCKLCRN